VSVVGVNAFPQRIDRLAFRRVNDAEPDNLDSGPMAGILRNERLVPKHPRPEWIGGAEAVAGPFRAFDDYLQLTSIAGERERYARDL
jgi:hypothetical protein